MSGNDLLMRGGLPSVGGTLKNKGDKFRGQLVEVGDEYQSSSDGVPDTWPDGKPKLVIPVTLINEADQDMWCLHVPASGDLQRAFANAVRKADCKSPEPGGYLEVALVDLEENKDKKKNPKKIHFCVWTPPTGQGATALMNNSGAATPSTPAESVTPAATQTATGGLTEEMLAQLSPEMAEVLRQAQAQQQK